jgi:Signal transduction histidine kinase
MGARMRAHDWSGSPLGQPETWPQSLRTLVRLMLNARHAMFIAWGPALAFLYNDAYIPIFGAKHPGALGRPFAEVWADIWHQIGPLVDSTLSGEAIWQEDLLIPMERNGYRESAYFTFSYTPVHDDSGAVAGMFCAATETTDKVFAERQVATERERLRELFHQAPGFMAVLLGPDHTFEMVNASYDRLVGHRDILGKPLLEALPEVAGQGFKEILDTVYATGEAFVGSGLPVMLQREPDSLPERRFVNFVYQPIRDVHGRIFGIFAEGSDITDTKRAEEALRASEARLKAVLENVPVGIIITEAPTGRVTMGNPQAERIFRHPILPTPDFDAYGQWRVYDAAGRPVAPRDYPVARALLTGETTGDEEYRYRRGDGTMAWMWFAAAPIRDAEGAATAAVVAIVDIDQEKKAEEHHRLLINELNHRVKNTLATVQSIATQTLRNAGTVAEARVALEERLFALSRAHDVLTRENWESADLREIVDEALAPYRHAREKRLHAEGPVVRLSPRMALAIAMALQELATNAVKYGALSNDTGEVSVRWSVTGEDGPHLHLVWTETGGPPVTAPSRRGFGTRLIERSLAHDLNGRAKIGFTPAGVVCTVDAPLETGHGGS